MGVENSNFINACYGRNTGKIPIWIMRQAGRYLPEYRKVRDKVSFRELCRSPKLIAEVVEQPIKRFGLDAAILFSDILTMLEPMGIDVSFPDGGPKIANPIKRIDDVRRLSPIKPDDNLSFVMEGIRRIKKILPEVPLIGFAGSPFTLACYLIEGQGSRTFNSAKIFLHRSPDVAEELFDFLSDTLVSYLQAQVEAGAEALQLFESWGGVLSNDDFSRWVAGPINKIFARLSSLNVPRILFVNNVAPYYDIIKDIDCEVIGVDYRTKLSRTMTALPNKAVQGNLDPAILFGPPEHVIERTEQILNSLKNYDRLIFNLGHGILPETPLESVRALVDTVHNYRD
ncbi:MAG: uroporphyrinogen decarboxylase [Candidatus Zixiibacteriota bacterium]|nr:MAG: uroporphyrinogen decarboxylase [candidate division Zixibacteria bacterium]